MRTTVKIGSQHKITVPAVVRDEMDLDEGDVIEIEVSKVGGDA